MRKGKPSYSSQLSRRVEAYREEEHQKSLDAVIFALGDLQNEFLYQGQGLEEYTDRESYVAYCKALGTVMSHIMKDLAEASATAEGMNEFVTPFEEDAF